MIFRAVLFKLYVISDQNRLGWVLGGTDELISPINAIQLKRGGGVMVQYGLRDIRRQLGVVSFAIAYLSVPFIPRSVILVQPRLRFMFCRGPIQRNFNPYS